MLIATRCVKPKHQNIEQLNDVLDKTLLTMQDVLQSA